MKINYKCLIFLFLLFINNLAFANNKVLNIFIWTAYLPESVIQQFEKQTGIHVNYSTYESNEAMYAKLLATHGQNYDIVVPSADYIQKMRRHHMLLKLDKNKLHGLNNLYRFLLNTPADPSNQYSVPYSWGTSGIVINDKYFSKNAITSWQQFWNKNLKNQLVIYNNVREAFIIAMRVLGYSINNQSPKHIQAAYKKLVTLMPNIKLFNSEASQTIYMDEDATIGMAWNGDAYFANKENPHVKFIYPKEGVSIFIDSLAIPKHAPHIANAYKFINFILQPKIAKEISLHIGYSSPNRAAVKLMPQAIQHNRILYPTRHDLRHAKLQLDVSKANLLYQHYWELLKIGA